MSEPREGNFQALVIDDEPQVREYVSATRIDAPMKRCGPWSFAM